MEDTEFYRCQLIHLKQCDDPSLQAEAACEALVSIDGILLAAPFDNHSVHIIYGLDKISFELITELLAELGFEMDDSILISLRNTIYCYLEDNARDNLHIDVTNFEVDNEESEVDNEASAETPQQSNDKYWEDYH